MARSRWCYGSRLFRLRVADIRRVVRTVMQFHISHTLGRAQTPGETSWTLGDTSPSSGSSCSLPLVFPAYCSSFCHLMLPGSTVSQKPCTFPYRYPNISLPH